MLTLYMTLIEADELKDKFNALYLKYRNQMKWIAYNILGDDGLAEDAVHNAFLRILSNLEKFSEINCQETKNLIVIIIRSVSIDMYRKRNREYEHTDVFDREISAESDFSTVQAEDILKEIETLPEIYRDVLLLKVEYEYKDREIAKLLDISTDTVSKRLERARKQLKQKLINGGSL